LSEVQQGIVPPTWWPFEECGHNDEAQKETGELLGKKLFSTPKPLRLLQRILTVGATGDDLVLDFFAGSAAFGHAVMLQNAMDSKRRRFICVQLPEPLSKEVAEQKVGADFCTEQGKAMNISELSKERLRRAGASLASQQDLRCEDIGFRVFKLDSGNVRPWEASRATLTEALASAVDHVKPDRTDDDLLYDVILKHSLDLCSSIEEKQISSHKVSAVGGGTVFTCFGSRITAADVEQLADGIAKWRDELAPANPELSRVIFRDSAFETDVAKTNLALILKERGFDEKLVVSL
jgi:adenine-specific DNA-methyltransferase